MHSLFRKMKSVLKIGSSNGYTMVLNVLNTTCICLVGLPLQSVKDWMA
jgi:hypothetical protein